MTLDTPITMDDLELLFGNFTNVTVNGASYSEPETIQSFYIAITIVYLIILISGVLGNTSTCIVIARNRSMHTATNFYLFSLAISDLVLLLTGLPLEVYRLWVPDTYPLGEFGCVSLGLASEASTNATILTIAAFTVERYIAICKPFMSHTMSKLSRAVRFIIGIWVFAVCTAVPQVMQFGIVTVEGTSETACTVKGHGVHQVFVISSFIFFVVPMSLISVLYAQIGLKLRNSSVLHPAKKLSLETDGRSVQRYRTSASQRRVIRMLVAVALSFFVCWAPFHVQRLLAIYGKNLENPSETFVLVYVILNYISGILYFLSTAINPFLYNIMSNKFREAFKTTLSAWFGRRRGAHMARTYSTLLASRRERAVPPEVLERARGTRRLRRLSTATTQLCDAPQRAQRLNGRDLFTLSEASGCGRWSLAWRLKMAMEAAGSTSPESARSISNSSLREFEEELTGEELTTFMYQVNCDLGFT